MYQIEDIIRSFQLNITAISSAIVEKHDQSAAVKGEIQEWYIDLISKMKDQKIENSGHLNELKQTINELQELHDSLLTTYFDKKYIDLYDTAKPALKELTVKAVGQKLTNQIDVALHGVYGFLVLRLKQQTVSEETKNAMQKITAFLAHLALQFNKMESGELKFAKEQNN